ncbi:hypothetical protein G5B38_03700 [Pseudohalocynthiibacter aestuariivivens]|uniref:Uncharacterized protein n=1 Tax=Roseovarius pelagicus TaxID=2980108 RepID=A0ABY6DBK6_9RHOB|nr:MULTISPECIES: hypothetical protein [Rhodobacterales]QIE44700.1 hypothetical protein G5B38_03700 [Pseudohalocynthiibacter aestuariivivens]UXX83389.1 hypothetical protein N7U68_01500 [Roseovarius pelagicus]
MSVTEIIAGLEQNGATGDAAMVAARLGFLEWAFAGARPATPDAARAALSERAVQRAESAAAQAFVAYLQDATRPITGSVRPGGKRRRRARPH